MKFLVDTAGYFYTEKEKKKLEKLGFTFIYDAEGTCYKIEKNEILLEINTLDEMMDFIDEYGKIVIEKDEITIYDNYNC